MGNQVLNECLDWERPRARSWLSVREPGLDWESERQVLTESFREPGLDWELLRSRSWLSVREPDLDWELLRVRFDWERPRGRSWLSVREPDLDWELPRARSWLRASESQVLTENFREPGLDWELLRARSWLRASESQVLTERPRFYWVPASGFMDWSLYGKRRTWSNGWRSGSYFGGFLFVSRLSDQILYRGLQWLSSLTSGKYRSRTSSDIRDDLFHIFSNSSFTQ